MRRQRGQQGAALLLVIGVVAALAVLAGALVMLTVNAAGNTGRDRSRAKSFNMAEATIDHALSRLGQKWPSSNALAMAFTATEKATFLSRFPESEFGAPVVSITYFDDVDANHDGVINHFDADTNHDGQIDSSDAQQWDTNGNTYMYVEGQAEVGTTKARIQVKAKMNTLKTQIPHGVAVATNQDVQNPNAASNNGTYAIGCDPATGGAMGEQVSLSILAGGTHIETGATYGPAALFGGDVNPADGIPDGAKTGVANAASMIISPSILQSIIESAKMTGTWYSDILSEQAAGAKPIPAKTDDAAWEGLVVVETTNALDLESNAVLNGDGMNGAKLPGALVVIGPHTMYPTDVSKTGISGGIQIRGTGTYYGVVYTDGNIEFLGNMTVLGVVVGEGQVYMNGSRCVQYNDNVVTNLDKTIQVNAQTVQDTWRQIQPL